MRRAFSRRPASPARWITPPSIETWWIVPSNWLIAFTPATHDVVARHMLGADREFFPYLDGGGANRNAE
jgi:hypothetical protein